MPLSWDELRELWDDRDMRYRLRARGGHHVPLSAGEADSVRAYRLTEVAMLPPSTRSIALSEFGRWTPPTPIR